MADGTQIEWTDATWNVVIGCDKVSPGGDHCYAIRTAHRMQANPNAKVKAAYAGTEADGEWTGQVNLLEDRLDAPLKWRRPRRIFVNAQSDLFHKSVPDEFIARVWAVMANAPRHTFQILTKRPGRMRSLLKSDGFRRLLDIEWCRIPDWAPRLPDPDFVELHNPAYTTLPNVWLGVSVETQQWADLRIPVLSATPAAVRLLSMEPLLGPVDLSGLLHGTESCSTCGGSGSVDVAGGGAACPACGYEDRISMGRRNVDWVIVGGESGRGARPMHPDWARSLRDQCTAAGVPFLFKQWGEWAPLAAGVDRLTTRVTDQTPVTVLEDQERTVWRVGKKAAGREIDGRTWDEFPEAVTSRG